MSDFFSRHRRNACSYLNARCERRRSPLVAEIAPHENNRFCQLARPITFYRTRDICIEPGWGEKTRRLSSTDDTRSPLRRAIDFSGFALRFRSEPAASRRGSHEAFSLSVAMHRDSAELEPRSRESRLTRRNAHALRFRNA